MCSEQFRRFRHFFFSSTENDKRNRRKVKTAPLAGDVCIIYESWVALSAASTRSHHKLNFVTTCCGDDQRSSAVNLWTATTPEKKSRGLLKEELLEGDWILALEKTKHRSPQQPCSHYIPLIYFVSFIGLSSSSSTAPSMRKALNIFQPLNVIIYPYCHIAAGATFRAGDFFFFFTLSQFSSICMSFFLHSFLCGHVCFPQFMPQIASSSLTWNNYSCSQLQAFTSVAMSSSCYVFMQQQGNSQALNTEITTETRIVYISIYKLTCFIVNTVLSTFYQHSSYVMLRNMFSSMHQCVKGCSSITL